MQYRVIGNGGFKFVAPNNSDAVQYFEAEVKRRKLSGQLSLVSVVAGVENPVTTKSIVKPK